MRMFASAVAVSLVMALFVGPAAQAADPIGKVAAVLGKPSASGAGGSRPLSAGSQLFVGDTVKASNGGNVQIILDDGTKLVVGPASQLLLNAYLRKSEGTASKVGVKALRGYFRFITGNSPKSAYVIQTSSATVGIRGTGFDLRVRDRTLAAVLVGAVRLNGGSGGSTSAAAKCGVAEAGGQGKTRQLTGRAKSKRLKEDFPYIINQSSLRSAFQLPIGNCRQFILANRLKETNELQPREQEPHGDDGGPTNP